MLHVRHVAGRYPQRGVLRSDNIITSVVEVGRTYCVRIDDEEHSDAWLEITLEDDLGEPSQNGEVASSAT